MLCTDSVGGCRAKCAVRKAPLLLRQAPLLLLLNEPVLLTTVAAPGK
jgi:hypothetical protein